MHAREHDFEHELKWKIVHDGKHGIYVNINWEALIEKCKFIHCIYPRLYIRGYQKKVEKRLTMMKHE